MNLKKTKYDKDEEYLIKIVEKMLNNYGINLNDIIDILKDNFEER